MKAPTEIPTEPIKPYIKFRLAFGDNILNFEHMVEAMINDGWELSGEMVITPLQYDPKKKHDDEYLRFHQPMIRAEKPAHTPLIPAEPSENPGTKL